MRQTSDSLAEFLRAVHRRHVALRVLERAALGALGACAVAAVLAGVMLWRGQDAWAVAGMTLLIGAFAGAIWGMATRPTMLAAATEADRQLRTADLLGTAWALGAAPQSDTSNESFGKTVLALAAARCEGLSPSSVVLHRLGARAWGGIGLALAFVATLAAMSSGPLQAKAQRTRDAQSSRNAGRGANHRPIVQLSTHDSDVRQARRESNTADDRALGTSDVKFDDAGADDATAATDDSRFPSDEPGSSSGGSGTATTTNDPKADRPRPLNGTSTDPRPSARADRPSAGIGRGATDAAIGDDPHVGGTVDEAASATQAPPWGSPAWSNSVEAATLDVRAGRVPDAHRDLVRGYFDPAASRGGQP